MKTRRPCSLPMWRTRCRGGFAQTLNLSFVAGQPASGEVRRAAELIREVFANPEWAGRR